jgi:hypothetical protein
MFTKSDLPLELQYLCVHQLEYGCWIGPDIDSETFQVDVMKFRDDFDKACKLGISFSYGYVMELGGLDALHLRNCLRSSSFPDLCVRIFLKKPNLSRV